MNISLRAQRVYAGIALMDERHGQGWVFQVDPDTLDMSDPCMCVIGQTYAGEPLSFDDDEWQPYSVGVREMNLDLLQQGRRGFHTVESVGPHESGEDFFRRINADYEALTRIWAYAIRRLRELRGGES